VTVICVEKVVVYEPERMLATGIVSDTWGHQRDARRFRDGAATEQTVECRFRRPVVARREAQGFVNFRLFGWLLFRDN